MSIFGFNINYPGRYIGIIAKNYRKSNMHRIRNLNKYALSAGESCVLYVQYLLLSQTM
jgi:hypothetical protein